jgi:hypothetical protein
MVTGHLFLKAWHPPPGTPPLDFRGPSPGLIDFNQEMAPRKVSRGWGREGNRRDGSEIFVVLGGTAAYFPPI